MAQFFLGLLPNTLIIQGFDKVQRQYLVDKACVVIDRSSTIAGEKGPRRFHKIKMPMPFQEHDKRFPFLQVNFYH